MVYTDEWNGYARLARNNRGRATVNHAPGQRERARDDDGDGIREVHDNTREGLWTALRTFRGISKHYLDQYVAIFQWAYNLKEAVPDTLRIILRITSDAS
ncbi:ISXO2-like transposase domain protein [Gemmata sp. SH-PL17]|nr:ISXO2-like transposase domain protein [Gemmata sp. SH-PL17]